MRWQEDEIKFRNVIFLFGSHWLKKFDGFLENLMNFLFAHLGLKLVTIGGIAV